VVEGFSTDEAEHLKVNGNALVQDWTFKAQSRVSTPRAI
jgi:hypothetical protein